MIQQLRYPYLHHKHIYLHLYYTSTTIPHIFITNTYIYIYLIHQLRYPISSSQTQIFTFILYSNYDTPYLHHKHIYLHLYYTSTTIPHIFITNTYIFIYTTQQLRHPISSSQTHIFTFILYINYDTPYLHHKHIYLHLYYTATYDTPYLHHKHIYLHLYYTATTIPHIFITNTYIYIYTIHQLRYPRKALQFFAYIPGASWNIQHLTNTMTFKDHWPHDLHDLAERHSQVPRTIDNMIYMI